MLRLARTTRRLAVISGHGVGKSRGLASIIVEEFATQPGCRIVCTATTNRQVHDVLWGEVKRLAAGARVPLGSAPMEREWRGPEGRHAIALSVDDPTAIQGIHGRRVLVVVDEAEGVEPKMWAALDSLLSGGDARMIVAFNPVNPSGYCFEITQRKDWKTLNISCLDHPNVVSGENVIPGAVTRQWVEEVRERNDPHEWASRVLGQFPEAGSKQLVSLADLAGADETWALKSRGVRRLGLDVARFGGDKSVLCLVDEFGTASVIEAWSGEDLVQSAGKLRAAATRLGVESRRCGVDVCGVGAGVVDALKHGGFPVTSVDFGAGAAGDYGLDVGRDLRFANRRAELHWAARTLVKARRLRTADRAIRADLCAIQYDYDPQGRVRVESKDSMRERLRRSPDHGDALMMALGASAAVGASRWMF